MAEETWRESAIKSMKREDTIYDELEKYKRIHMKIMEERENLELELNKLEDQINQEKVGTDYYHELLEEIRKINGRILDINDINKAATGKIIDIENKIKSNNKKIINRYKNDSENER